MSKDEGFWDIEGCEPDELATDPLLGRKYVAEMGILGYPTRTGANRFHAALKEKLPPGIHSRVSRGNGDPMIIARQEWVVLLAKERITDTVQNVVEIAHLGDLEVALSHLNDFEGV